MTNDLAAANVNRSYSLAGTSIAIFTFMLFFQYPMFESGKLNALLFQVTLVVMGLATFSFVFASLYYYYSSLGTRVEGGEREAHSRRADRLWLLGDSLLFLVPSLILGSLGLLVVGSAWLVLWLAYVVFLIHYFPKVQSAPESPRLGDVRAE